MEFNKIDNLLGKTDDNVPRSITKNGSKYIINQIIIMI